MQNPTMSSDSNGCAQAKIGGQSLADKDVLKVRERRYHAPF